MTAAGTRCQSVCRSDGRLQLVPELVYFHQFKSTPVGAAIPWSVLKPPLLYAELEHKQPSPHMR